VTGVRSALGHGRLRTVQRRRSHGSSGWGARRLG
jgi:hypothetical protein